MAGAVELTILPALSGPPDAPPSTPNHLLLTCEVRAPILPGGVVDASGVVALLLCLPAARLGPAPAQSLRLLQQSAGHHMPHLKRQPLLCAVWS